MFPEYTLAEAEQDTMALDPVAAVSILVGLRYLCVQLQGQLPPDVQSFLEGVDQFADQWTEDFIARGQRT